MLPQEQRIDKIAKIKYIVTASQIPWLGRKGSRMNHKLALILAMIGLWGCEKPPQVEAKAKEPIQLCTEWPNSDRCTPDITDLGRDPETECFLFLFGDQERHYFCQETITSCTCLPDCLEIGHENGVTTICHSETPVGE